jgi:tetratricopeptide (TPR) repeat protein
LVASIASAQESATDAAKTSATSNASDPNAALAYGRALRRAGKYDDALKELRRGVGIARAGDVLAQLHWEIARVSIDKRDFPNATVACKVAGAQTGGAAKGHACMAEAHLLWRRGSEALTETQAALAGGNKLYEAKICEARALALSLKDAESEAAFKEAISWKPNDPQGHFWYGKVLFDLGKADNAVTELKTALQNDAADPDANYELARALRDGSEALQYAERAVKERGGYTAALVKQAELLAGLGRSADARKAAEAAVKTGVNDASIHLALGNVALAESKPDEAMAEANKALAIMANSSDAKLLVADAYAAKKEIDLAVEQYQASYGLDHTDPEPLVHASNACRVNGRITSAKAFGDKATKEFPTWGPAWVAFGDALAADKEPTQAKAAYEKALAAKGPVDQAAVKTKMAALH